MRNDNSTQTDVQVDPSSSDAAKPKPKRTTLCKRKSSNDPPNPFVAQYEEDELRYYKKLSTEDKRYVVTLESKIDEMNSCIVPLRFRILFSEIDDRVKAIAIKKVGYLSNLDDSSSEYYKILNWIHAVCELPINHYKSLPVSYTSPTHDIKNFIIDIRQRFNAVVHGHSEAKEQIIRLLAQWVSNPDAKGMVIGIHGPMGCGKTTLIKDGICKVLGLPFAFIPLGGASDGSYLEGHSYTYEGATWGKIVDVLMKCKCMNPVFYFDELDKVSNTYKGDEIINILIHMTDSSQNESFQDKYFTDLQFDLSKSLIIFSYNDEERINPILRDRMVRIYTNGYSLQDKLVIAQDYMFPLILKDYSFSNEDICIDEAVLKNIINMIDDEKGVRNLKRALQNIVSHLNLNRILDESWNAMAKPYVIKDSDIKDFVNNKRSFSTLPFMYT
ncbi:MAG: AAA family ATPase [Synechococcus sp.]|nr:AAA family ATPase [Synechococcus sp.]